MPEELAPVEDRGTACGTVMAPEGATLEAQLGDRVTGGSREFRDSKNTIYFVFAPALLFVFLVLTAQFGSIVDPLPIPMSVPTRGVRWASPYWATYCSRRS